MQVKATDHPDRLKEGEALAVRVERKHLLFWIGETFPVILVVHDVARDRAYWLHVQEEFRGGRIFAAAQSGARVTLRVPAAQLLDGDAVGEFRRRKLRAQTPFQQRGP
jgi:hypothetical protein